MNTTPTVKIKPGKRGAHRAPAMPWVYADQIAMDRRTRKLAPGTLVRLVEGDHALGLAAFNRASKIAARIVDPDPDARVDEAWFAARLGRALGLRQRLFTEPFYRLVHAEGDDLPGLVVDRFGDALVIQPNAAWVDRRIEVLCDALAVVTGCDTMVMNGASRGRRHEGLDERIEILRGRVDGPVPVRMNGATYMADLTGGQKTGLFFDQRLNHRFAASLGRGARVLDVCTHVGGFALAALAAGAERATGIDSSGSALELAREGARRTGVAERFTAEKGDAFDALSGLAAAGETFDLVICDPPAFAPSKQALAKGLRAYERLARLAAGIVAPGGWLMLCSCSHAASPEAFHRANVTGMAVAGRSGPLVWSGRAAPDHPIHAALPETGYLKAMVYRLDG